MNEIIQLDSRRSLKKAHHEHPPQQAASPAQTYTAQIIGQRRCLVCQKPSGSTSDRYCPAHRGAYWKWLQCIEEGCEFVGERKIPGQTIYRCPQHRNHQAALQPVAKEPEEPGSARQRVKEMLAARRQALAQEKTRSLPPRPPHNIGNSLGLEPIPMPPIRRR